MSPFLLLFLGCLAVSTADELTLRPLRIYSQNLELAKEAVGNLSYYFNVSLYDNFDKKCDELVALVKEEPKDSAGLLIVTDSEGSDCNEKSLRENAVLVKLDKTTTKKTKRSAEEDDKISWDGDSESSVKVRVPRESDSFDWVALKDNSRLQSAMKYTAVGQPSAEATTAAEGEKKSGGIVMPIWGLILHIVVDLLLLGAIGGVFWWGRKQRKSADKPKSVEEGKKPLDIKSQKSTNSTKSHKSSKSGKSGKSGSSEKSSRSSKSRKGKSERSKKEKSEKSKKSKREKSEKSSSERSERKKKSKKDKKKSKKEKSERSTSVEDSSKSASKEPQKRSPPKRSAEPMDGSVMRSDKVTIKPAELPAPPERSLASKLTEAVTATEFQYYLSKIAKVAIDYYDDPTPYNVTTNEKPGFLYKKFPKMAPENPEQFGNILQFFNKEVMQGITHWQHPRFFAYYPTGRCYPDMLSDLLISSLGVVGFSWDSCPAVTEMEHAMVNWLGRGMGIPETHLFQEEAHTSVGGGAFFESASEAVFCSMLAARQWKISELTGKDVARVDGTRVHYDMKTIHEHCQKLIFYTSKDAHSAMEKGCKMALTRCRPIQALKENDWGVTGAQLEKEILKDIQRGLVPTYVYVTLGTTSTAACDHLESIWPVAEKYNMYIHVDAAYSGMFWIDPKFRHYCKGMEHAWSINANMHKTLLHSANSSVFFCKNKKLHMDAFAVTPIFLKATHKNAIDYRDWGINLTRRFKAIKTWFVLSLYGMNGLRDYVRRLADLGEYFMTQVAKHPNCRIFGKCNFGLFCFQYKEDGMTEEQINEATTALCRYMNESNKFFFTHTRVDKSNLIRVSWNYERGTRTTVDESWCMMQDLIEEFKQNRANIMKELPTLPSPLPGRQRAPMPGDDDIDIVGSMNLVTEQTRSLTSLSHVAPMMSQPGSSIDDKPDEAMLAAIKKTPTKQENKTTDKKP